MLVSLASAPNPGRANEDFAVAGRPDFMNRLEAQGPTGGR